MEQDQISRTRRCARLVVVPVVLVLAALPAAQVGASTPPRSLPTHLLRASPAVGATIQTVPHGTARSAAAGCSNGDCPSPGSLSYLGGPIVTTPTVYLVRFSDSTTTLSPSGGFVPWAFRAASPNASTAISAILTSPYEAWWSEYSRPASATWIRPGSVAGSITLYNPALADDTKLTSTQIGNAIRNASSSSLPSWGSNSIFVLFFRAGQTITAGSVNSLTGFCGYHSGWTFGSGTELNFAVIPNEASNPDCAFAGVGAPAFEAMTTVLSHEVAETVTDPAGNGWLNTSSDEEVGDMCAHQLPLAGNSTTVAGISYTLQFLFSNKLGACIDHKVRTTLVVTSPARATISSASVLLSSRGTPLASAKVFFVTPTGTLAKATTNAAGAATVTFAPTSSSTLTAFYEGSSSYAGSLARF